MKTLNLLLAAGMSAALLVSPLAQAANDKTNANIDKVISKLDECIPVLAELSKDVGDFKRYSDDQVTNLKEWKTIPQDQLEGVMAKYKAEMWRQAKDKIKNDIKAYDSKCSGITGEMKGMVAK